MGVLIGALAAMSLTLCEVANPRFKDFYAKEVERS